jgi:hypothetical protein
MPRPRSSQVVNTGLKALLFAEYPHSQNFSQIKNP